MAEDIRFNLQEGEYECHSLATGEYSAIPATFGEFLTYIKNPDDVAALFKKLKLTVICYTNDGQCGAGMYNYYPSIKKMMEITEGSVNFSPENFAYQHVFILSRNEAELMSSSLTLAITKPNPKSLVHIHAGVTNVKVDFDLLNSIASEIPFRP